MTCGQILNLPLVTFVLFAYNQENLIREAIKGALSQNYKRLEIILSDDCSSDKTYIIMQEMVADYNGPHKIKVIRNSQNMGLISHVLARGREACGEIVVVAAGDDISKPERTRDLVQTFFEDKRILAVTSAFDVVDEKGLRISENNQPRYGLTAWKGVESFFKSLEDKYILIQGSTAAYRREVFNFPLPDVNMIFAEDVLFNYLIYANGGYVEANKNSLILYRQHPNAITNRVEKKVSISDAEIMTYSAALQQLNKMRIFEWIAQQCRVPKIIDIDGIRWTSNKCEIIISWPKMTLSQRIICIVRCVAYCQNRFAAGRLVRIFGKYPNYQPRKFISRFQRQFKI